MKTISSRFCRHGLLLIVLILVHLAGPSARAYLTVCRWPVILPEVKIKNATLPEAVAYVKGVAFKSNLFGQNHLNVVILGAPPHPEKRINLDLQNVSLQLVMENLAQMSGMKMRIEAHAIVLAPATTPEPVHTRIYRVPPDFIQTGSAVR